MLIMPPPFSLMLIREATRHAAMMPLHAAAICHAACYDDAIITMPLEILPMMSYASMLQRHADADAAISPFSRSRHAISPCVIDAFATMPPT